MIYRSVDEERGSMMSTYYSYFLRAPLKDPSIASVARFGEIAAEAEIYFDIDGDPIHNVSSTPHFGKSTVYDGPGFQFKGMDVSGGTLRIGVFAENLERTDLDYLDTGDDDQDHRLRVEKLMAFLSEMTTGSPGEVQGSFGSEFDGDRHGNPIIRCADGGLRILRTDAEDDYDWYHGEGDPRERYEGPLVAVGATIPADLVDGYRNGAFLSDIREKLVERLRGAHTNAAGLTERTP